MKYDQMETKYRGHIYGVYARVSSSARRSGAQHPRHGQLNAVLFSIRGVPVGLSAGILDQVSFIPETINLPLRRLLGPGFRWSRTTEGGMLQLAGLIKRLPGLLGNSVYRLNSNSLTITVVCMPVS